MIDETKLLAFIEKEVAECNAELDKLDRYDFEGQGQYISFINGLYAVQDWVRRNSEE